MNFIAPVTRAWMPLTSVLEDEKGKEAAKRGNDKKIVEEPGYSLQELMLTIPSRSKVSAIAS